MKIRDTLLPGLSYAAMLMNPNLDETAVHGCHRVGDMNCAHA